MSTLRRLDTAAHQCRSRLLIENCSFFRLVIGMSTELQTIFKYLLCSIPITLQSCYLAQYAIDRDTIVHKTMQGLDTLKVGGGAFVCPKVQKSLGKKWDIELAAVSCWLRECNCSFQLHLRCCPASCNCQEVSIEGNRTWVPFGIDGCLYRSLKTLFCLMPIAPAEIQFRLCLQHYWLEASIIGCFRLQH